ncbi:hypothetical protein MUS_2513 [Bacillus velezensis YAU B9601-Y2]|uniref:Uncharacterized protein n=1 Tax=Bacillus amyloliquefaciens (strain Y2) TaxID=1155777 RepID=I2C717_BACAY|nr:hypothetical protein MUS_2513 [Bacillus velezensis YAU B9601-Y2]
MKAVSISSRGRINVSGTNLPPNSPYLPISFGYGYIVVHPFF